MGVTSSVTLKEGNLQWSDCSIRFLARSRELRCASVLRATDGMIIMYFYWNFDIPIEYKRFIAKEPSDIFNLGKREQPIDDIFLRGKK